VQVSDEVDDIKLCSGASDPAQRKSCIKNVYYLLATSTKERKYCNKIPFEYKKEKCHGYIDFKEAVSEVKPELCYSIQNAEFRDICRSWCFRDSSLFRL